MSTEFFNDQWRIPSNKNQNKVSNYSMEFNGSSTKVDLSVETQASVPSEQSSWTYSCWLYLDSTAPAVPCIFERGAAYPGAGILCAKSGQNILVYLSGTLVTFDLNPLPTDEWAHFALVYSRSINQMTCYINNSPQQKNLPSFNVTTTYFEIGRRQNNHASYWWLGKMTQASVFDYALPATGTNSIATLYGGGTAVTNPMSLSPAPVAYYQLGDQSVDNGANYLVPNNSLKDYVFDFDENDDYIDLSVETEASVPSEESSWTYSAWLYLDSTHTESFPTIFQRGQAYPGKGMLVRENSGNINVFVGTSISNFTVNKLPTNAWSHFALVYDLSTNQLTCCVNNSFETITMVAGWSILTTLFNIGFRSNNTGYWKGEMSNIQVFNTALPETGSNSIETIYNNGSPLTSMSGFTSLQSWYKLNAQDTFDGTNWTIEDYAGSNDGTSSGMTSANLVQSNLQHTSGYSPYALDFDGINDYLDFNNASGNIMSNKNAISISGWFKLNSNVNSTVFSCWYGGPVQYLLRYNVTLGVQWYLNSNSSSTIISTNYFINVGDWVHVVGVKDPITNGGQSRVYVNGTEHTSDDTDLSIALASISNPDKIGAFNVNNANPMNGCISNVAYWTDTALTQAQVTEIYNQGVPSNLNTFSGTSPNHWLQIGSNSSFNTNWTCLDEIGTSNATSVNMTEADITNGPGYSANGLGTSTIDIKGDAPYSSGNGLSENMDVLDRVTDIPS